MIRQCGRRHISAASAHRWISLVFSHVALAIVYNDVKMNV